MPPAQYSLKLLPWYPCADESLRLGRGVRVLDGLSVLGIDGVDRAAHDPVRKLVDQSD